MTQLNKTTEDRRASPLDVFKQKWFWDSIVSAFCWTGWAFTARFGSRTLPANMMEFVAAFGSPRCSARVCSVRR